MTVSFLSTSVCSSFYLAVFFPVGFYRILNSFLQKLRLEASSFINHMKIDFISNFNTLKRMPLNLTNTIRLNNIHPNLINFIYDSKLNNKMSDIFGLHGIYYKEQAVQDARPLQVQRTGAEKFTECCPQDPGQAPGPTPAVHGLVLLHHHRVSHQHQRENGQRGRQAAAVQNHNLKRKN